MQLPAVLRSPRREGTQAMLGQSSQVDGHFNTSRHSRWPRRKVSHTHRMRTHHTQTPHT